MDASIGQAPGALDDQFCNAIGLGRPFQQPEAAGFPASDPDIDYTGCTMCAPLRSDLMTAERQHELTRAGVLAFLLSELEQDPVATVFLDSAFGAESPDVAVAAAQ